MKKNNQGFIPIIIIFLVVAAITAGLYITYRKYSPLIVLPTQETPIPTDTISPELQDIISNRTSTPLAIHTPTPKSIVKTTAPTVKPTVTATPHTNSSCPYNTTGATGAIKINVHPQSGILIGDQLVELDANSGCNVLLGSSSANYVIRSASSNGYSSLNTYNISSVPAGPYTIKIQYKGQWAGSNSINVSSSTLTTTDIYVSGDSTPTTDPTSPPVPVPTPFCFNPIAYPASGSAPLYVIFTQQGGYNGGVARWEWDYLGNGTWSSSGTNAGTYTYQSPGTYTIKVRNVGLDGKTSDTCQTTVTVTP